MNGLIPGTGKLTPAGSGGAGTAARGKRTAERATLTLRLVASWRPASSPMAAAATATPAVTRKARLAVASADRGCGGRSAGTLLPGRSGARSSSSGLGPPGEPGEPGEQGAPMAAESNTIGGSGSAAVVDGDADRADVTTRYSANAPAAAPHSVGSAYAGDAPCLVSAATRPITANRHRPASPSDSRRIARIPITTAKPNSSTKTPSSSTVLSSVPNVEVAQSLTGSGVRSMAACPTAITGDAAGIDRPASSWAIPIATAAASTPQMAPTTRPGRRRVPRAVRQPVRPRGPGIRCVMQEWSRCARQSLHDQ